MSSRKASQSDIESVRLDIEREGASVAYQALLQVCRDPKAPAQAKAAAGVAVLRAGGLYDPKRRPTPEDDPSEMTADQLREGLPLMQAELKRIQADLAERQKAIDAFAEDGEDEDVVDVFA